MYGDRFIKVLTGIFLLNVIPLTLGWAIVSGRCNPAVLYRFDEGTGASATDSSGNGYNGLISGATFVAGHSGTALRFGDGSQDNVEIPREVFQNFGDKAFFKAWIRPTEHKRHATIFNKRAAWNDWSVELVNQGNLEVLLWGGGNLARVATSDTIPLNTWTKVACWYDGRTLRLYINDVESAQVEMPLSFDWYNNYIQTQIGNNTYDGAEYRFVGDIDDVVISCDRVLDAPHSGEITVVGGTIAGQTLSRSSWHINANPGAKLTGSVEIETNNIMSSSAVAPLGYTWTWGDRTTAIATISGSITPGRRTWSVPISLTAPVTAGTYYLLFGFNGEYTLQQVFSCTNWSTGAVLWNDGNDYFDLGSAVLEAARPLGYVASWNYRYSDGMRPFDVPVAPIMLIVASSQTCYGTRSLPSGYVPGQPIQVSVQTDPPSSSSTYAVEEAPPSGWSISSIDNGGTWDVGNGKVKWGPFFDATSRKLHYNATPPSGTSGIKMFSGIMSINGTNQTICGTSSIDKIIAMYHPADTNQNWRLEIAEMTAYGTAWRQGTSWPTPPNPIPIEYVTNSGFLWKSGETYHYDSSKTPPWVTGATGIPPHEPELTGQEAKRGGSAIAAFNPAAYTPGSPVTVSITVAPDSGSFVYAVEDGPPSGWVISAIDSGGSYDSANHKVKWGPYFDNQARTFTYKATPPSGTTGAKTFAGTVSIDGSNITIAGTRVISSTVTTNYTYTYWIPIASHASGDKKSQWRTDVGLLNLSSVTANIEMIHYVGGAVKTNTSYVTALAQSILTDVIAQVGSSGTGPLKVRSDQPLVITSRTYNQVASDQTCFANGTQGQSYPTFIEGEGLSTGQNARLPQLTENDQYRSNITLVNLGGTPALVTVTLYDGAGAQVTNYSVTINPGERQQDDRVFLKRAAQSNLARGWASVVVNQGSGVVAFASVVDNITNDPTTIVMVKQ